MTESQSADAEPPPPPKPDLSRYAGLRTHLTLATTEGKEGMQGPRQPLGGEPRAAPGSPGARAVGGTGCGADPKRISTAALRGRTCPRCRAGICGPLHLEKPAGCLQPALLRRRGAGGRAETAWCLSGGTVSCGGLRRAGWQAAALQGWRRSVAGWRRRRSGRPGVAAESTCVAACVTRSPRFPERR